MTLHDRVEQLTKNFAALRGHDAEAVLLKALRVRVQKAKASNQRAKSALASEGRIRKQIGALDDVPRPSAALSKRPKALNERLEQEALDEVIRDQEWPIALFSPLDTYLDKFESKLLDAWQAAIDAKVPDAEAMFLQLERLGYEAQVARARAAMKTIQTLRASLPGTDTALAEVDKSLAIVQATLQTLQSVPPALRGFLARLAGKTATLVSYEELDEPSRDWLKKNNLIHRIRLNLT